MALRDDGAVLKVFLLDPVEVVRIGLTRLLEEEDGIVIAGQAGCVEEALEGLRRLSPDVLLMDGFGLEAAASVVTQFEGLTVIVFSMLLSRQTVEKLVRHGVQGLISKLVPAGDIGRLVRLIHDGARLAVLPRQQQPAGLPGLPPLTPREEDVIRLLLAGMNTSEAARSLSLSERTVRTYVSSIHSKFGTRRRDDLMAVATAIASSLFGDLRRPPNLEVASLPRSRSSFSTVEVGSG
ncbi:MAG: response regulator transcription factor [bacterium]|nr:response regulator transcription factor [bacterium]